MVYSAIGSFLLLFFSHIIRRSIVLKGIAKSDGDSSNSREGIIVALSQLTKTMSALCSDLAFQAAAEAGATFLHVPKSVVFQKKDNGGLELGGSYGVNDNEKDVMTASKEIASTSLKTSRPILYSRIAFRKTSVDKAFSKTSLSCAMCVPMRVGKTNMGAIVVMADNKRSFSPSDTELLHVVASQVALAVWRSNAPSESLNNEKNGSNDLIQLAQRKIQELSVLNQISEAINSTLDLGKLIDIALNQSMESVGADAGSLMLVSEETHKLEIVASKGLAKWIAHTTQSVGTGIAGWVAEHGESVLVTNAHEDPRFNMHFFRDNITSSASVPLKVKGTVIGVLNVNTKKENKIFDERDLEMLGTVANQMAVAIENARLYARVNRRNKQLDTLLEISKTVTSTLNLDVILQHLSTELCKLFQLDICVILLVDEVSERLRFGYGYGLKTRRKSTYFDLAKPIALKVLGKGRKQILRNINSSSSLSTDLSKSENLLSAIAFPLKNDGKPVGVAVGFCRDFVRYVKSQRAVMGPIGDMAGVAIKNARVYRQKYKIADILQQRLLPSSIPEISKLDIGHKFLPAREVGGDYFDFVKLGQNRMSIVVGDVSGSDVEAAEYTTMGKHVLRTYARDYSSPSQILTKTNNLIYEDSYAEMFISLFYGVLDVDKMKIQYANAGCEPPIFFRAEDKSVFTLNADGMLLGIVKDSTYEEREIEIRPGDVLAVFTDGLPEAAYERKRFGSKRVMDIISQNANLSAQEIVDCLYGALLDFVHGRITDDVAIVVVKILS